MSFVGGLYVVLTAFASVRHASGGTNCPLEPHFVIITSLLYGSLDLAIRRARVSRRAEARENGGAQRSEAKRR